MYKIISISKYGKEEVDSAETMAEALYLAKEYRLAFGSGYEITIKKQN
jgi:hypothetical protein